MTTNRFNFCRKISNESEGEREGRVNSSRRKKNSKPEESGAGESVTADGPGERNSSKDKHRRTCYLFIIGCPRNRVAYNELSLQYWMWNDFFFFFVFPGVFSGRTIICRYFNSQGWRHARRNSTSRRKAIHSTHIHCLLLRLVRFFFFLFEFSLPWPFCNFYFFCVWGYVT